MCWLDNHAPVNFLRKPERLQEMQFVECRSAPEPEFRCEERVTEYLHEGARDDQVLLNLPPLGSVRCPAPFNDVLARDHSSTSGRRRTTTRHLRSRSTGSGAKSGSLASPRSSSVQGSLPLDTSILCILWVVPRRSRMSSK